MCISEADVAGMFAKWKAYFKTKMKDEDWGLTTILLWKAVLNEYNVTARELDEGTTKACFDIEGWPPTTATDFIRMVRGSVVSEYPDTQTAFETACQCAGMLGTANRDWKHPTVREAANRIGWGKLAAASNGFIKYFEQVYKQVIAEHQNGATFEIPKSHRVENKHIPASPDSPIMKQWEQFYRARRKKKLETEQ